MADEIKIEDLQKQCDEYLNGWKRAKADLANLQKDMARERSEWVQYASAKLLERFLPLADAISAAVVHEQAFVPIARKVDEFLTSEGITPIPTDGKFDPGMHEAVGRKKMEGIESGTIVDIAQIGYKLQDKILRPAKVIVAE